MSSGFIDPMKFVREVWPDVTFYRQQQEIIYSVVHNDETYVPAGNALGKDFVAAFIALWWFISRRPARVVTTSVKVDQLEDVLWGEIRRFIETARIKLPIKYNHLKIRRLNSDGSLYPNAELVGQVSNTKEGLLGRHSTAGFKAISNDIPRTLVIFDEASGIDDETYTSTQTWAHRKLIIGNPFPCENFFKRGVKAGDLPRPASIGGYYRKVIKIKADDSPNVLYARAEIAKGKAPSNTILVPGVKSYSQLLQNRELWDKILQCVGLDAEFYEGAEVLLYPPDWLNRAERLADSLIGKPRKAVTIGIDPAEGGDKTSMSAVDEYGLIELVSKKTPDTSVITSEAIAFGRKHGVPPENWLFDLGGGGKEHVDRLRSQGYAVRGIAFGGTPTMELKRGTVLFRDKVDTREEKSAYRNRRSEMYGLLRELLDPAREGPGFAIPREYHELRRQLAPIPLTYDPEGRLELLPKDKRGDNEKKQTLKELLGCSPDEADSLVLAVFGMLNKNRRRVAGAI